MFWPGSGGRNLCQILSGFLHHLHPLNTQWSGEGGAVTEGQRGRDCERRWVAQPEAEPTSQPHSHNPSFSHVSPSHLLVAGGLWSIFPWSLLPEPDSDQSCAYNLIQDARGGTSLVVQWLRICRPMRGMWVQTLVGELKSHMPGGN